ncbi:ATP-grasp domain-containing protein [Paludibacterium yongneupense]|uniref:ATP-grasp domain-containing protein n=1 Tax=Paludibacterium yongneupense TaxID=400061 RepID=UPI00041958A1|nr:ATP-grasp domain-containing protein [Paludibacterium yongneupense]
MNIVILHRIPFDKIRYDLAIDHFEHNVTYLCLAGGGSDLPSSANKKIMDCASFDISYVIEKLDALLNNADRLIARSEYDLLPAALLREHYGIQGDKTQDVLPLRDKFLMRTLCRDAGICQPNFWSVEDFYRTTPTAGRYLIKPRMEASSVGIVIGSVNEILAHLNEFSDHKTIFIEQFVPGEVFHVDGYVNSGELISAITSVYVGDCLNYTFGSPLGSVQTAYDSSSIDLANRTLKKLGHRDGSFHFEGILSDDGNYLFLEVACRVGGAGVAETFELKTGINLYQVDLHYQIYGQCQQFYPVEQSTCFGWFVYPGHHYSGQLEIQFESNKWISNLVSYQCNSQPRGVKVGFTYAPDASPLNGILRGKPEELKSIVKRIFDETQVCEVAQ